MEFEHGKRIFGNPGDVVEIGGLSGKYEILSQLYDYRRDRCTCPHCGGLGFAWRGWFTCEDKCETVAFIPTGEVFLRQP
jgi:hypothetical protein